MADNLPAGTYNLSVTDASNCTLVLTGTVGEPDELIVSANVVQDVTCLDGNDGIASVGTTTGGNGGYTYLWTDPNGQTGQIANNLAAGEISVIAMDINFCTATDTVIIANGDSITLTTDVQNISCTGRQDETRH